MGVFSENTNSRPVRHDSPPPDAESEMPGLRLQRGTFQSLHLTSAYRRLPWRDAGLPRGQAVTGRGRREVVGEWRTLVLWSHKNQTNPLSHRR